MQAKNINYFVMSLVLISSLSLSVGICFDWIRLGWGERALQPYAWANILVEMAGLVVLVSTFLIWPSRKIEAPFWTRLSSKAFAILPIASFVFYMCQFRGPHQYQEAAVISLLLWSAYYFAEEWFTSPELSAFFVAAFFWLHIFGVSDAYGPLPSFVSYRALDARYFLVRYINIFGLSLWFFAMPFVLRNKWNGERA